MAAILTHLRAEARSRWPSWFAVVVLIGLVGGLVLGALSGARRTHTAYDRLTQRGEAWDVMINPNSGSESEIDPNAIGALPEVAEYGTVEGVAAVLVHDGQPTLGSGPLVLAARDDRVLIDFSRPRVVEGTLYDPGDPTQILIDGVVSDHYGIGAGDRVEVATGVLEDLIEWEMAGSEGPPPLTPRSAVPRRHPARPPALGGRIASRPCCRARSPPPAFGRRSQGAPERALHPFVPRWVD